MRAPELAAVVPATYVKRRRVKGWRMPAGGVSCTRGKYPTRWGNQFRVGDPLPGGGVVEDHEHAVDLYRAWLRHEPLEQAAMIMHLAGRVLLCWCAVGKTCHVQNVIIPLVNEGKLP